VGGGVAKKKGRNLYEYVNFDRNMVLPFFTSRGKNSAKNPSGTANFFIYFFPWPSLCLYFLIESFLRDKKRRLQNP
jgi:hypothetical protein